MGQALLTGLIQNGFPANQLHISDPKPERCKEITQRFGVHAYIENLHAISHADLCVLAVKPTLLQSVCTELCAHPTLANLLIISLAAGVSTQQLHIWLKSHTLLVRAMPNTPASVAAGVTALFAPPAVATSYREYASHLFASVGAIVWLENEEDMHTATALSGSGPAYFFLFAEILLRYALSCGLHESTAKQLIYHTIKGSGQLLLDSTRSASDLRKQVTSPKGTTQAALDILQSGEFEALIQRAVTCAHKRAEQLACSSVESEKSNPLPE